MKNNSIVETLGNTKLLELRKIVFFCSSKYSSASVLKSYDWATEQQKAGNCVISGFHSPLEKDVLDILLRGEQPVIMVLARGIYQRPSKELLQHLKSGRLLIVTPFDRSVNYITKETAEVRNRLVIALADEIVVAHITKGGQLEKVLNEFSNRKITVLDR